MTSIESICYKHISDMVKHGFGIDYHKWLLENSKHLSEVDTQESQIVAKDVFAREKHCYYNCWRALSSMKYKYFEGYVSSKDIPIPIEHCWLVKDDKVIDPTLIIDVKFEGKKIVNRIGDDYLGVEIPMDFVFKKSFKIKKTGPFIFDYYEELKK